MARYKISDAALLAEASYSVAGIKKPRVIQSCPDRDVQAYILEDGMLLLTGSNSVSDYFRFNLRVLNLGHKRMKMSRGQRNCLAPRVFKLFTGCFRLVEIN